MDIIGQHIRLAGIIFLSLVILLISACSKRSTESETRQEKPSMGNVDKAQAILSARSKGLAYLEENELEQAEKEFLNLIELAPGDASGYANLGIVYMRMGRFAEAEGMLKKAVELDPENPDIRLNLAKVYELTNQQEQKQSELEKNLEMSPDHVQTLYSLAETYQGQTDQNSLHQWEQYMSRILKQSPGNIAAKMYLIEALVQNGKQEEAIKNLEELWKQSPAFPEEASEHYHAAIRHLRDSDTKNGWVSVMRLHNILKLTSPYQGAIRELRGSAKYSTVGTPVITFNKAALGTIREGESILESIRFTDATRNAGLSIVPDTTLNTDLLHVPFTHLTLEDMDLDGDEDIYLGTWDPRYSRYARYLLENDLGRFQDITEDANITHKGNEFASCFADYDNDGYLDLYVVREGSNILYANVSEGVFRDVTLPSGTGDPASGSRPEFFDMDQDGDLDLFLANRESAKIYRNNGDGSFTNVTKQAGFPENLGIRKAGIGDFDDDGDADLFLLDEEGNHLLNSNVRQGQFLNNTVESALNAGSGFTSLAIADYNNDGYLDLFISSSRPDKGSLFRNDGKGKFSPDPSSVVTFKDLSEITILDSRFFDFDNDGFQDLIIAGNAVNQNRRAVRLYHNNGKGNFEEVTYLLPDNLLSGRQIEMGDYNQDGDLDLFIAGIYGGVRLIRNDGGNLNHHLRVQVIGLRTGSSKNNYYGIGSKVEVRSGELYQMKTITEPSVHFGLGHRDKVDVVRILWTNGVAQNIFSPSTDQDLIEQQVLKGSCPFLYTWNGERFIFQKDFMWRSALGMPMGIMGGSTTYAFPDASDEYIKIPGDQLKMKNGLYSIQVTAELWETIYFDQAELVVVDHPGDREILVDEKFIPPPYPELKTWQITDQLLPVSARNGDGRELKEFISKKDDRYISDFVSGQYQGLIEPAELILDPGNIPGDHLLLIMNGWIFPTDASINVAISQSKEIHVIPPKLQMINSSGTWETVIENIGFPMGKDKTMITDLSGKFLSGDHRIRILSNMEIYWDFIYFTSIPKEKPLSLHFLRPVSADLHFRGFSSTYRKGGAYGPHWFDYEEVSKDPKWRDLSGRYTRYGQVQELMLSADNQYVIMNAGDEVTLHFNASNLPTLPPGWKRDFLFHSIGWVKDGDMNTATGNRVEPLPFHGNSFYPYNEIHTYPDDPVLKAYHRKYNTRQVNDGPFKNALRNDRE